MLSALEQPCSPEVPLDTDPVAGSPQLQQTQPGLQWCAGCPLDPLLFPKDTQRRMFHRGEGFVEENAPQRGNALERRMLQKWLPRMACLPGVGWDTHGSSSNSAS